MSRCREDRVGKEGWGCRVTASDLARVVKAALALFVAPSPITALALFVSVAEAALPFIPTEDLKSALTESARKRADAIADAAEAAKFGS